MIVSGQTGTGKTALGVALAKKLNGEIVSFDSRQAYRYLDIVTGKDIDTSKVKNQKLKITGKKVILYIKEGIPIWLYDLIDPKEYLSAYDFCNIAEVVVEDIIRRGKLPIIVGGSVFYIKVFLEGLGFEGVPPDWNVRKELEKKTLEELHAQLAIVNNDRLLSMNNSDKHNKRRLIRAIEIGFSQNTRQSKINNQYKTVFCALFLDKNSLKDKIQKRVMERMRQGACEEVKNLLKKNYSFDDPGLQTIGYKQLRNYFEGSETLELSVKRWIQAEAQYAKRQMVFLKKMKSVIFMPADDTLLVEKVYTLVYSSL